MTTQPNPSQFRPGLGAPPPAPTGLTRLMSPLKMVVTGGVAMVGFGYILQLILPYDFRPSVVAGRAAGETVVAETDKMRDIRLDYERRLADATAQASAKAQTDVLAAQMALQERTAGLAGLSGLATLADAGCILGQVIAGTTNSDVPARFRGRDASDDWNDLGRGMAKATCGLSDPLRQHVTQSQLDAIRTTAAARGAPMTNGAVQVPPSPPAPASQPQPVSRSVAATLDVPHRRLNADQQRDLRMYANRIPVDVLRQFVEDIDMTHGYPDTWYDRVAYYKDMHTG